MYSGFLVVLYVWRAISKVIRKASGSQCRSASTCVMWSYFLFPETTRASVLMTRCTCWGIRRMYRTVKSCRNRVEFLPSSKRLFGRYRNRYSTVCDVELWCESGQLYIHCQRGSWLCSIQQLEQCPKSDNKLIIISLLTTIDCFLKFWKSEGRLDLR